MRLRITVLAIISVIILLAGPSTVTAQVAVQELVITQVDASEFPQVTVRFRALDSVGFPAANVQLSSYNVRENGQGVLPENLIKTEAGIWVHFVVDAGIWMVGARWTNAKTAITDFVQTTPWMKENLDNVALTVVSGNSRQTLVPFTENGRQLLPALESFTPPGGSQPSVPIPVLDQIVAEMFQLPEAANQAKFIVFVSSGLETSSGAAALGERARDRSIPVYVIGLRSDQSQPLQMLAEQSGGRFSLFNRLTDVAPLYGRIVAYREQYDISYRSTVSQSGNQQVELIANVSATGHISDRANYDIEVNLPRVLIQSPKAGDVIARRAPDYIEDRAAISPTTATVVASVIFPDGHLRRLQAANLLVNGVVANQLTRPNPTNDLEFVWSLRDVQQDGINDFALEVEIIDELGLVSRSPAVTAKVDVTVPPKPEAPIVVVPTVDVERITEEVRRDLEATMAIPLLTCFDFTPEWLCSNVERPIRRNWIAFLAIAISVTFSGVVWVNRDKAPVQRVRDTVMRGVDSLTKRYLGPSEAKAYLIVLEGDVNIGKSLEIFGDTPIGRSKQNAELLFQQHDDTSPLSRLHCTIVDEEDHFLIRDEDSANGTYLNGRKLTPLETEELHEGDEIELARVERGGVRLLFQLARPDDGEVTEPFRVTRQTRSSDNHGQARPDDTTINEDRF
jgi:Mg-chelatase subunit ChlD